MTCAMTVVGARRVRVSELMFVFVYPSRYHGVACTTGRCNLYILALI